MCVCVCVCVLLALLQRAVGSYLVRKMRAVQMSIKGENVTTLSAKINSTRYRSSVFDI